MGLAPSRIPLVWIGIRGVGDCAWMAYPMSFDGRGALLAVAVPKPGGCGFRRVGRRHPSNNPTGEAHDAAKRSPVPNAPLAP